MDSLPAGATAAVAQARQGEHLVSNPADHVLRLPHPTTRDARAGMQRIEPAHADQLDGDGQGFVDRVAGGSEEQAEVRADGAELPRRPEGDIDLQRAGQQEDPIDDLAAVHVEVMDGSMVLVHPIGPVRDRLRAVARRRQRQGEIDV